MIKSFTLGAKEYEVFYEKDDRTSYLGLAEAGLSKITITTELGGKDINESAIEQTLYHEVVHCILHDIGRPNLSDDEVFVQTVAMLMHQFIRTMK